MKASVTVAWKVDANKQVPLPRRVLSAERLGLRGIEQDL